MPKEIRIMVAKMRMGKVVTAEGCHHFENGLAIPQANWESWVCLQPSPGHRLQRGAGARKVKSRYRDRFKPVNFRFAFRPTGARFSVYRDGAGRQRELGSSVIGLTSDAREQICFPRRQVAPMSHPTLDPARCPGSGLGHQPAMRSQTDSGRDGTACNECSGEPIWACQRPGREQHGNSDIDMLRFRIECS